MDPTLKRLQIARTNLLLDQPFFGVLALHLEQEVQDGIGTACTDGRRIKWDPKFVDTLANDELLAVMAHEVMHCACGHPWRRDLREPMRWNIACDFAINEILEKAGFKMPKNTLRDSQYDGKSAEWIYDRIKVEYIKMSSQGGKGDPGGMGGVEDAGGPGKDGDKDGPTEADWQQNVQQSLNAAKAQGKLPANFARMLGDLTKARVDWRSLLRRYIQEVVKADYTWTRPNVRYIPSGLFLPALHSEACGRIVCAIDTSGSIDDVLLNQFASEVQAIAFELEPSSIEVVYCDAAIQRVDEFTRGDAITMKAAGGGGTSFRPVFERYANDPPVVLVYLTDMMGDFPSEVPEYPVIWASTGHDEAPFGDVVVCQ